MKYKLGLTKSPFDGRDYLLKSFFKKAALPPCFDLTDEMTPVRSQMDEGACVGFATAVGVKEFQETHGEDAQKTISLSPRYVYEEAKMISGHEEGTTLKAAMEVVKKRGVCEEKYWPYIPGEPGERSPKADKNAERYKVKSYARITNINELKQAIVEFGATLIGVYVYNGMVKGNAVKTGIVPDPSCFGLFGKLGGHAITACGYTNNSPYYGDGHIKFKNSWGADWGDKGYGYLSYNYIEHNMVDAFSCIDIEVINPLTVSSLNKYEKWWV